MGRGSFFVFVLNKKWTCDAQVLSQKSPCQVGLSHKCPWPGSGMLMREGEGLPPTKFPLSLPPPPPHSFAPDARLSSLRFHMSELYVCERVLFIGTRFINRNTAVDTPAAAAWYGRLLIFQGTGERWWWWCLRCLTCRFLCILTPIFRCRNLYVTCTHAFLLYTHSLTRSLTQTHTHTSSCSAMITHLLPLNTIKIK